MIFTFLNKENGKREYIYKITSTNVFKDLDGKIKIWIYQEEEIIKKLDMEEIEDFDVIGKN